jgi:hypothetical protein
MVVLLLMDVIVFFSLRRNDMPNVVELLEAEKTVLLHRLDAVSKAISALSGKVKKKVVKAKRKGKKMSEATKAKIRASAKARWAKIKKA